MHSRFNALSKSVELASCPVTFAHFGSKLLFPFTTVLFLGGIQSASGEGDAERIPHISDWGRVGKGVCILYAQVFGWWVFLVHIGVLGAVG